MKHTKLTKIYNLKTMITNNEDNRYLTIIYEACDDSGIQLIYECFDTDKLNYLLLLKDEMDMMDYIIEEVLPYADEQIIIGEEEDSEEDWCEKMYDVYVYVSSPDEDEDKLLAYYSNPLCC